MIGLCWALSAALGAFTFGAAIANGSTSKYSRDWAFPAWLLVASATLGTGLLAYAWWATLQ